MALFEFDAFFADEMRDHAKTARSTEEGLRAAAAGMLGAWEDCVRGGGKILFFGNGGSAADAQHLATELVVRFKADRPAIAAIALTTDTSALTAGANDFGFETIFARQIEALGRKGDLALGFSTSGNSSNVLKALETARSLGIVTGAFTGSSGGRMAALADHTIAIPSRNTARIQEMHITVGHVLCGALEKRLGFA